MRISLSHRLWVLILVVACSGCRGVESVSPAIDLDDAGLDKLSRTLSESPRYFDTDNLISNENSFLQVLPALADLAAPGGAYIGVGPDQNYSYLAHADPAFAVIIDIRRENLLQHLYFKQLMEQSPNRWQYLARLLGKELPQEHAEPDGADAEQLCDEISVMPTNRELFDQQLQEVIARLMQRFPRLVRKTDAEIFAAIASPFFKYGLDLRFRSHGRRPRRSYPTLRELIQSRGLDGQEASYLSSQRLYARVRELHRENRIVPVVGDLGGHSSLKEVGELLRRHGLTVSVFYTSNVEFYLFNNQTYDRFVENVRTLPVDSRSLFVRSYFGYWRRPHPETLPGFPVTSLMQKIEHFLASQDRFEYSSYHQLIFGNFLPLYSQQARREAQN